jgi:hypothetical protein
MWLYRAAAIFSLGMAAVNWSGYRKMHRPSARTSAIIFTVLAVLAGFDLVMRSAQP